MTKEEAIEYLKMAKYINRMNPYTASVDEDAEEVVDMAIKALESQRWIPCEERLPEKDDNYLVTLQNKESRKTIVEMDYYASYGWDDDCELHEHTAWMPLPEPYEEVER